jgi:hypothetical protein
MTCKYSKQELENLLEYATNAHRKSIQAIIDNDCSIPKAAIAIDKNTSNMYRAIQAAKITAAKMGYSPEGSLMHKAPAGFSIDRVSSFIDDEGKVSRQWVIANRDKEDSFNSMMEAWKDVCSSITSVQLTEPPKSTLDDLLCDYTIGDNHTGMFAIAKEAGDDWNLDKSIDILDKAMNHLVAHAPAAKTAFILDVGDFFHSDNQNNVTNHSGNPLDVDGRYADILSAGINCICKMIQLALQKHEKVIYRSVIGNHNEHSAIMINLAVKMRFHDEPRLEVLDTPNVFNYYQFGVNLLADTHGHTTKADNLPMTMAVDVPQMWADTTNRVWRTGHVHHLSQKEYAGCTVITYRTLAPKDAWHSFSGYRSNREMRCTIYHRHNGTVGMNIVNPSMLGY